MVPVRKLTSDEALVSVVIPAYNAESTLDETLYSVRRQTYPHLEVVVVDDGSTDGTAAIAARHATDDNRIRLLHLENSGVAAARNAGIAATGGAFVAPIDSDDLWHPDKIAQQMASMRAGGSQTGFVYAFCRRIDRESRVLHSASSEVFEGAVYLRLLLRNFVGSGSTPLIRRTALTAIGGYDPDLRRQGAEGCEDYLMQLLIARSWKVGCVPAYLIGYRWSDQTMSRNLARMLRSHLAAIAYVRRQFPETPGRVLAASEARVRAYFAVQQLRSHRPVDALFEFWHAMRLDARSAAETAWMTSRGITQGVARRRLARRSSSRPEGERERPHFLTMDPWMQQDSVGSVPLRTLIRELAGQEADFFAPHRHGAEAGGFAGEDPAGRHGGRDAGNGAVPVHKRTPL